MIETLLIQILGNSPTLLAILLVYWRLDRRVLQTELKLIEIEQRRRKRNVK